jgi:UDP-2-acetamido-3-amino-2,3-dideoxy-glucuronate N-acetyltransferase
LPLKVLLIGLGRWGQVHLKTWRQLGVELLVCDASAAALEQAKPLALKAGPDYRELLAEADVVDVVTPAPSHHAIVTECLNAGKDVICEKPLTLKSEEGYELAELAHAKHRILQVGHVFRFEPCVDAVRQLVNEGRIGKVRYILSHFMGFKRPRSDGGVAVSDAIHFIDLVSYLLQKQPKKVTAILRDYFERGMDDTAFVTLDFGPETAHIEAGYFPPERRRDLQVMGEKGSIVCDFLAPREKVKIFGHAHEHKGSEWVAIEGETISIDVPEDEPLRRELKDFMRCVEKRTPPLVDGYAGAHAVATIEAAVRSAREEQTVPLEVRLPPDDRPKRETTIMIRNKRRAQRTSR